MKKLALVLLALFLMSPAVTQNVFACGADCGGGTTVPQPRLIIEFAPVFANPDGSNQTIGTFFQVYNAPFNIGPPTPLSINTNTGIYTPAYTPPPSPPGPPFFFYYNTDYWIKTQTGVTPPPPMNEMVIQLEGNSLAGGDRGFFDIDNDGLQYAKNQTVPAGEVRWGTEIKIGAYDIPFPSAPTVLTNSRLQYYLYGLNPYDPGTQFLPSAGWPNVFEDPAGGPPVVHSSFDANGLDVWFDFQGGTWAAGYASESQAVRMVTFFNGDFPLQSGTNGGGGGSDVPEPTTMLLLGSGLAGLWGIRKKFKK